MFKSLREKLSGWFGEKKEAPKMAEKPKKKFRAEEAKNVGISAKKKKAPEKVKRATPSRKEIKTEKLKKKVEKKPLERKLKEKADEIREDVPVSFNAGRQKFEPDVEKIEKELEEKKTGFFGRIKKAFVSEEKEKSEERVPANPPDAVSPEVDKKEEIIKATFEAGKEFDREGVEERAEELRDKIEEEEVEKAKNEEEVLSAAEVEEEVSEKKGFFGKLAQRLTTSELKENEFDEFFDEFEFILLEHNVALGVVDKIRESLKGNLVGKKFGKKEVEQKILGSLKGAIEAVLIEPEDLIKMIKAKDSKEPFVILFFGINGSGKTTSVAKLAHKLKKEGFGVVMAAGDTFRAASIEQLETHGERLGIEVVKSDYGKDPASVAFDAIAHAKKKKAKVVLIDTAGRMYTRSNLMKEMEKIVKVSKPDLKIFVGESITGNDATEQAKMFHETAGIDGIILSKADVDEKAGTILSVSYVTGKPILFLGVGQNYEDLEVFSKKAVLRNLGLD